MVHHSCLVQDATVTRTAVYVADQHNRSSVPLSTGFFAPKTTSVYPVLMAPACSERMPHGVLAAPPVCYQFGHLIGNFFIPLHELLEKSAASHNTSGVAVASTSRKVVLVVHGCGEMKRMPMVTQLATLMGYQVRSREEISQPVCFRSLLLGLSCAQADHYNKVFWTGTQSPSFAAPSATVAARQVASTFRSRMRLGAFGGFAQQERGLRLLILRSRRRILNPEDVAKALPGIRSVDWGEHMTVVDQVRLAASADAMVGMGVTSLFNAMWMAPGSRVVQLRPYLTHLAVPEFGKNLFEILTALNIPTLMLNVTQYSSTRLLSDLYKSKWSPEAIACLTSGRLRMRTQTYDNVSLCQFKLVSAYGLLFNQDTVLSPADIDAAARFVDGEARPSDEGLERAPPPSGGPVGHRWRTPVSSVLSSLWR
jgi:hypothetical protein